MLCKLIIIHVDLALEMMMKNMHTNQPLAVRIEVVNTILQIYMTKYLLNDRSIIINLARAMRKQT